MSEVPLYRRKQGTCVYVFTSNSVVSRVFGVPLSSELGTNKPVKVMT